MKSFAVGTWETERGRCGERKSLGEFFSGGGGREGEVHMMRGHAGSGAHRGDLLEVILHGGHFERGSRGKRGLLSDGTQRRPSGAPSV